MGLLARRCELQSQNKVPCLPFPPARDRQRCIVNVNVKTSVPCSPLSSEDSAASILMCDVLASLLFAASEKRRSIGHLEVNSTWAVLQSVFMRAPYWDPLAGHRTIGLL